VPVDTFNILFTYYLIFRDRLLPVSVNKYETVSMNMDAGGHIANCSLTATWFLLTAYRNSPMPYPRYHRRPTSDSCPVDRQMDTATETLSDNKGSL